MSSAQTNQKNKFLVANMSVNVENNVSTFGSTVMRVNVELVSIYGGISGLDCLQSSQPVYIVPASEYEELLKEKSLGMDSDQKDIPKEDLVEDVITEGQFVHLKKDVYGRDIICVF